MKVPYNCHLPWVPIPPPPRGLGGCMASRYSRAGRVALLAAVTLFLCARHARRGAGSARGERRARGHPSAPRRVGGRAALAAVVAVLVLLSACRNGGLSGPVAEDEPQQFVLREGLNGYSGTRDTMMSDDPDHQTTNYGLSWHMQAGYWGNSPDEVTTRTLLKFDVTGLPENAETASATLRLVFNNVVAMDSDRVIALEILEPNKAWEETEATWQRATDLVAWDSDGGDYSGSVGLMHISPSEYGTDDAIEVSLDAAVVQRWISNPADNRGMLFRNTCENTTDASEKSFVVFYTKDYGTDADRPSLIVEANLE